MTIRKAVHFSYFEAQSVGTALREYIDDFNPAGPGPDIHDLNLCQALRRVIARLDALETAPAGLRLCGWCRQANFLADEFCSDECRAEAAESD